jgi:hypothetical protein
MAGQSGLTLAPMKRRRPGSRSKRYKRRLPGVLGWSCATLLGLAALVAVASLHGNKPEKHEQLWSSLHTTLAEPVVTALAAFAAALLVAWGVRHLILEYLAWRPGAILAEEFALGPDVTGADAKRLTAAFRDRLAFSHLQSAAPVPAPAQQGNFLDVLTAGGAGGGSAFASLLAILRAALPDHAYEVRGTLVGRVGPEACGVTVHVVCASGEADPGQTFWDTSWDAAVRRAADHATASILPRTRHSRPPWSAWRGFELPSKLFHSYERAAELEHERRYDEALDLYYKALESDPMNLGLRLQIGFLQEKLALFLDALATYEGIFEVARPGERPAVSFDRPPDLLLTRRARRDRLRQFYRLPARRDRDAVLLVAKYRRAILLGGQELPRQWAIRRSGARTNRRDVQRHQLRERLRPALMDLFPPADDLDVVLAQPETNVGPGLRRRFEELLVRTAIAELSELRRQLPRHAPRRDGDLSRQAVELARLWMEQRLARILSAPALDADRLTRSVRRIEGHARGFQRWQEHYNAACVYALPLLTRSPRPDRKEIKRLSTLAVERLKKAIASADSSYIASRRDWLLSDDPDLDGLRPERAFKSLEAMYFPAAARTPRRPRDLHKWEVSRYTIDLLAASAERWEEGWRRRKGALESDVDVSTLAEWLPVEVSAWNRVRKVAINHRHWQSRMALVKDMRRWGKTHDLRPLEVQFPRFTEQDASWLEEDREKAPDVSGTVKANGARLERLADTIEVHNGRTGCCRLAADLDRWQRELVRLDVGVKALGRREAARLCESHALLWRALHGYLRGGDQTLEKAIEETEKVWIAVTRSWRSDLPARTNGGAPASVEHAR